MLTVSHCASSSTHAGKPKVGDTWYCFSTSESKMLPPHASYLGNGVHELRFTVDEVTEDNHVRLKPVNANEFESHLDLRIATPPLIPFNFIDQSGIHPKREVAMECFILFKQQEIEHFTEKLNSAHEAITIINALKA